MATNWESATAILIGTVLVLAITLVVIVETTNVSATGTIMTVNCAAFANSDGTGSLTAINWPALTPNEGTTQIVYIENTGTVACNLTFATSDWNPSIASTYITVTGVYSNAINVQPAAIVQLTISEQISPGITGVTNYSYDILLIATG